MNIDFCYDGVSDYMKENCLHKSELFLYKMYPSYYQSRYS